jgi:PHP family Zn ribbon phosphoesterase
MDKLKEIIRKKLKEISATNQGGASFNAGSGETYATPFAFSKNNKTPKYYYKLGYKPVPDKIKGSGLQVKKLWEEEPLTETNEFQKKRLNGIDEIEKLLNEISPLVSNAKNETIELYSGNAGSYDITQPIEIVLSYLKEVKQLLTEK